MKIIMSPHGGCYNHGCEAIIRSTAAMLNMSKDDLLLYSTDIENDKKYRLDNICELISDVSDKKKATVFQKKLFAAKEHLFGKDRDLEEISLKHSKILTYKNLLHLSVGGDNYSYFGMRQILSEQIKLFSYNNIPSILWGCSIEEETLSDEVISHLKKYSYITARETLTYDLLCNRGIEKSVVLCSDPAFTLQRQAVNDYDSIMGNNQCIGINISAMMDKYDSYPNATYNNFKVLIEYLLKQRDCYIMLIPHVRQNGNDDVIPSKLLADELNDERIIVVDDDYNCMQLKSIISRCKQFISCRTHSAIAAYSTCVPTLAVGYSVKSKGIAKDIFGEYDDFLVDVRKFSTDRDLLNKYISFCERESDIKVYLEKTMPDYINKAYSAKKTIELIENQRM